MSNNTDKSALVVEGGGMRGIFAAGVLHAFGKVGFDPFDLYIGVSAGRATWPRTWPDRMTAISISLSGTH